MDDSDSGDFVLAHEPNPALTTVEERTTDGRL